MKRFLLPIIAGAMLSSTAIAAPAMKIDATDLVLPTGDQVISDLYNQNVGGINNVSLSKYEQAWMIVHDKESIFKHKTFWVRTGKVFTGIAIDDIKDLSKSERSSFIIDSIKSNVIITELKNQIEAANGVILGLQTAFSQIGADLEKLSTELAAALADKASLEAALKAVEEAKGAVEAKLTDKVEHLSMIEARIADLESKLEAAKANYSKGYTDSLVETLRVFKEELVDNGIIAIPSYITTDDVGSGHLFGVVRQIIQDARNYVNVAKQAAFDTPDNSNKRDFGLNPVGQSDRTVGANYDNTAPSRNIAVGDIDTQTIPGLGNFVTITVEGKTVANFISDTNTITTLNAMHIAEDAYDVGYDAGFSAGYDAGYSDGFEDGYNAGYADGFSDGVASVK